MKYRFVARCLILPMLVSAPAPVIAKEPLQLAPSSPWQIAYRDDSCRLLRKFGTGDQKILLTMDRFQPGDWFNLVISGKLARAYHSQNSMSIRFGPTEDAQQLVFKRGDQQVRTKQGGEYQNWPAIIFVSSARLPLHNKARQDANSATGKNNVSVKSADIASDSVKTVTYIQFGTPLSHPFMLMTGLMAAPFAAMRKCTDELIGHWGVDVAALATQSRQVQPLGNPGLWVTNNDYPSSMMTKGQQGIVHFRLSVDADGKPTACHIQQSTRPVAFDDAVCKAMMKRAKFYPALDAAGHPFASYYLNTVRFIM